MILAIDRLQTFPVLGRMVPEYQDAGIRELIVGHVERPGPSNPRGV
jgi:hypothetical protein